MPSAAGKNLALTQLIWNPNPLTALLKGAFRPAAFDVARLARSLAPGPRTARATRVSNITPVSTSAVLSALNRGPAIYPIVSGSRPGLRKATSGSKTFAIPGGPVVTEIQHPGTPAHPYLDQAAAKFYGFYLTRGRLAMRRFSSSLRF